MLRRAANSINDRPLGLRHSTGVSKSEEVMLPVTPNSLLLARASNVPLPAIIDPADEKKLTLRLKFCEEVEARFWEIWNHQHLADLFPRNKWKEVYENLQPGDLCLLSWVATDTTCVVSCPQRWTKLA